ncbi:hypothetical protein JTB14_019613 [Gonioctena quinquepunctata]|nr:hypothetical protein JTB14_019613 [Gonioctena quinquepunctata]
MISLPRSLKAQTRVRQGLMGLRNSSISFGIGKERFIKRAEGQEREKKEPKIDLRVNNYKTFWNLQNSYEMISCITNGIYESVDFMRILRWSTKLLEKKYIYPAV